MTLFADCVIPDAFISTHTSLAGRDPEKRRFLRISFRFLLTRPSRDVTPRRSAVPGIPRFLLTRPSRDVTEYMYCKSCEPGFLLTRPSRDVTSSAMASATAFAFLLTRPSRDVTSLCIYSNVPCKFLLTRPSRDVTSASRKTHQKQRISTHTSLAGRDRCRSAILWQTLRCLLTRHSRVVTPLP